MGKLVLNRLGLSTMPAQKWDFEEKLISLWDPSTLKERCMQET